MKWQRPLSLSILFVIIVVFVVINNGPNKTEDKENSSIRFKVKANVENRHSFAPRNIRYSDSGVTAVADQETESDDIEELLGFDDVIKPDPDSEQLNEEVVEYQDTGDFMDPDSEQLNEEVVEYQDTGDFMDPDSEQLNEEVVEYQDTSLTTTWVSKIK
jgi:hypothetical protein